MPGDCALAGLRHRVQEYNRATARFQAGLLFLAAVALVSEIFVESVQDAALAFGMTPAFVGFIIVSIVGAAAEMMAAWTAARKNRFDLSVGIALGSSARIVLFAAPVLVLLSVVIAPAPMDLSFWPGAVVPVLLLTVYAVFAVTLYLMPPATG